MSLIPRLDVYLISKSDPICIIDVQSDDLKVLQELARSQTGSYQFSANGNHYTIAGAQLQMLKYMEKDTNTGSSDLHRLRR
jgi:hypothetical protein